MHRHLPTVKAIMLERPVNNCNKSRILCGSEREGDASCDMDDCPLLLLHVSLNGVTSAWQAIHGLEKIEGGVLLCTTFIRHTNHSTWAAIGTGMSAFGFALAVFPTCSWWWMGESVVNGASETKPLQPHQCLPISSAREGTPGVLTAPQSINHLRSVYA